MRQTLSKTPVSTAVVFLLIPVVFVGIAVYSMVNVGFDSSLLVMFLFGAIFGVIGVNILLTIKNVEYDFSRMYILSRDGEVDVPFSNITRAVITGTGINRWKIWKIIYLDEMGTRQHVKVYPKGYVKEMDEFFHRVWEHNKEVEIDVWLPPDKRDS